MTERNQPVCTLLPFIASTEKTSAVIFRMLVRAVASFVTAKFFRNRVQRAYWPACKYTQINLLSVDKGGAVMHEQVFASLSVYCALIYLWLAQSFLEIEAVPVNLGLCMHLNCVHSNPFISHPGVSNRCLWQTA